MVLLAALVRIGLQESAADANKQDDIDRPLTWPLNPANMGHFKKLKVIL